MKNEIWRDKRRWLFGTQYLSYTEYVLTDEKIYISQGMLRQSLDEIRLYRILDISLRQTFFDRIYKVGTITVISSDETHPRLKIEKVREATHVAELISSKVEEAREEKRIRSTEFLNI